MHIYLFNILTWCAATADNTVVAAVSTTLFCFESAQHLAQHSVTSAAHIPGRIEKTGIDGFCPVGDKYFKGFLYLLTA